ncbi:MAG: hypothetical protein GY861_00270 [bacterium]|nr:hypothetical protein [bacterium]
MGSFSFVWSTGVFDTMSPSEFDAENNHFASAVASFGAGSLGDLCDCYVNGVYVGRCCWNLRGERDPSWDFTPASSL